MIKILYVCPFAHHPGHPPSAALNETVALKQAGAEVKLVTFQGIIDKTKANVDEAMVYPPKWRLLHGVFSRLRRWTPARWILMLYETTSTISKAIQVKRKENWDIFYLRDGEPFLFIHHLLNLPYKNMKWIVSLTAALVYTPAMPKFTFRQMPLMVYLIVLKFAINTSLWKLIYKISLKRNNFQYTTQNAIAEMGYRGYLGGVFDGRVNCLPLGMRNINSHNSVAKKEARQFFGLTMDQTVFLSFGAPHSGKDLDVVFRALKDIPDAILLHGGMQAYSLGSNPTYLSEKYGMQERVVIKDYYIPEDEKKYYYACADAIILSYTQTFNSTSSMLWEACQYELPVIASKNGELDGLLRTYGNGLLFGTGDEKSLRFTLRYFMMLSEKDIYQKKLGCKNFSADYSIETWAKRLIGMCKK